MSERRPPIWPKWIEALWRYFACRGPLGKAVGIALAVCLTIGLVAVFMLPTGNADNSASVLPTAVAANAVDGPAAATTSAPLGAPEPDWTAVIVDTLLKLGVTVSLVYGVLYLLRRYTGRGALGREPSVQVVETVAIGQHRTLHLVRVGHQHVLIGATSTQISMLAEVADPRAEFVGESFADHVEQFQSKLRASAD